MPATLLRIIAAPIGTATLGSPVGAIAPMVLAKATFLDEKAPILAPLPFMKFCAQTPDECKPKLGPGEVGPSNDAELVWIKVESADNPKWWYGL